ncbi:Putative S-adenosyl-L-methionine-dependent methyltransferase, Methyltransferase domain 25 [Septoria linicola]|uniref:S-adenosyl-L-methionine-dependent methyltransferase, Methyltransferase domain 25 n=1 Tax=Septoria linicola TaxID=215465 RepID=A0A9Q9B5T2_9PEZI|nr:Putative S-adenosyl-L-methionine-dependent methyltransferase, Methyltransferase domain 25 [Septoria linicola]
MEVLLARSLPSGTSTHSSGMSVTNHSTETLQRTPSEQNEQNLLKSPYELRYGRRYLRSEVPYPLPCDLAELQRQTLRTLLGIQVFGAPLCNPLRRANPPKKVLELGCGTAYWSAMCHDHFAAQGHTDIRFVGTDIAPLAPNLRRQGMKWKFVQHDMRRIPMPFDDNEFDLVMFKDVSMVMPLDAKTEKILVDAIRIVKPGGSIECWESDHVVRSLLNTQPPPPSKTPAEQDDANRTATFGLPIGHPFARAQNKYLQKANKWIEDSLDKRKLHPTPSTRIAEMLTQEPDLRDVGYRRVAIPFGELRWEKEGPNRRKRVSNGHDSPMSVDSRDKSSMFDSANLTPDQAALRQTALMTVLGQIESMEPMLKEVSGKNAEEWSHWWASMMTDLLDPGKAGLVGECLEMGAWWATKAGDPDDLDSEDDDEIVGQDAN